MEVFVVGRLLPRRVGLREAELLVNSEKAFSFNASEGILRYLLEGIRGKRSEKRSKLRIQRIVRGCIRDIGTISNPKSSRFHVSGPRRRGNLVGNSDNDVFCGRNYQRRPVGS